MKFDELHHDAQEIFALALVQGIARRRRSARVLASERIKNEQGEILQRSCYAQSSARWREIRVSEVVTAIMDQQLR